MKSAMPYRGIPAPALRSLLRPVLAHALLDEETWYATVLELWDDAEFREERYAALALARHRHAREYQQVHTLGLYEHLIRTGAWWDVVDETATHSCAACCSPTPTRCPRSSARGLSMRTCGCGDQRSSVRSVRATGATGSC